MTYDRPDYQPISTPTLPDAGEGQVMWFQSETFEVLALGEKDLISYIVPDGYELRVCSGIVSCKAPRTQRFKFITTPAGDWVSPTSHIDPDDKWTNEERAYDGNIVTAAESPTGGGAWSSFLELLINPAYIDTIKFFAYYGALAVPQIDVEVSIAGAWVHVYTGAFADREWVEKDIPAPLRLVSKARVRLYNVLYPYASVFLYEFMFNTAGETPQETIYFDTYAIIPYLPEAPYPVPSGATFVVRVYNDDEDKQWFSANLAGFLQAKV